MLAVAAQLVLLRAERALEARKHVMRLCRHAKINVAEHAIQADRAARKLLINRAMFVLLMEWNRLVQKHSPSAIVFAVKLVGRARLQTTHAKSINRILVHRVVTLIPAKRLAAQIHNADGKLPHSTQQIVLQSRNNSHMFAAIIAALSVVSIIKLVVIVIVEIFAQEAAIQDVMWDRELVLQQIDHCPEIDQPTLTIAE